MMNPHNRRSNRYGSAQEDSSPEPEKAHSCHGEHSCHRESREGSRGRKRSRPFGHHGEVLGTTTVGERGQVVIPREAREAVGIESGDRFVVFGDKSSGGVLLVKADVFNHFAELFMSKSKKLERLAKEILSTTQIEEYDEEDESSSETAFMDSTTPSDESAS